GDEARATLRAAAVIQGYEDVLMLHKKGPGEILLPAAFWTLSGQIDEGSARLPFALASLTAMFAVFLLGWRMLGPVAGWSAAMLFALDGYFIAFARFVQYQSVVVLLAALVVLILYRLYVRPRALTAYLTLAALFMATALLHHYDAAVTLIPACFLFVAIGWKKRTSWGKLLRSFLPAAAVGGVILAGFYLPYVLHPHFQVTFLYLADSRVGRSSMPYNNLVDVFLRSTVYNSSYYVLLLIALMVVAMVMAYRRGWGRRWGIVFSVGLLLLLALTLWRDDWLTLGSTDFLFLLFALALGLIWIAPRLGVAERTLWLWFGLPFVLAMFFIDTPRTHIYIFITPWVLLAGGVIEAGWRYLERGRGRRVAEATAALMAVIAIALFGYYAYVYFVYNQDEVLLTWEENHPSAYWTPYDYPESDSIYGFPFANGWKVVGVLYDRGEILGDFETNQWFSWIPDWYTRGQHRCAWSADWYFAIDNPEPWSERSKDIHDRILAEGYGVWGVVEVNGDDHMTIYKRGAGEGEVRRFTLSDFEAAFDEIASPDLPLAYPTIQDEVANPLHVNFGNKIWLEGYDLEYEAPLKPGDTFLLTLYWRAQQTMSESYKVFNQSYYGEGHMVAQQDGYPLCGRYPTPGWRPGELITDQYRIRVRDVPGGVYPLYTGLYLEENFERLPVLDEA
ncbi:MAG TPA: hypothetical protein EYP49_15245, partial [Anaerolineae bacterium]|nr:hypothetical protein [Anaerolineae bacterium]